MKVIKKPIVVSFRFAATDEVVNTLEGTVTAKAGDAIITGVKGETYPIQRNKFEASYEFDEATGKCFKKAIIVEAVRMDAPFEVKVGWSDTPIQGKAGDYHLTYGPGDFGAVAADVFDASYEIVEA